MAGILSLHTKLHNGENSVIAQIKRLKLASLAAFFAVIVASFFTLQFPGFAANCDHTVIYQAGNGKYGYEINFSPAPNSQQPNIRQEPSDYPHVIVKPAKEAEIVFSAVQPAEISMESKIATNVGKICQMNFSVATNGIVSKPYLVDCDDPGIVLKGCTLELPARNNQR